MIQKWERIEPTIVTRLDRRTIVLKTFIQPGVQKPRVFATFLGEDVHCAAVIAITKNKKVVVARQYRPGPERVMDELPGGGVEVNEDPQAGAMRELREETGYVSKNVTFLGTSCRDAYTNATWHYYLAIDCELAPGGQQLDEFEDVEVQLIRINKLLENARTDQLTDPHAVLMAYEQLKSLQEKIL